MSSFDSRLLHYFIRDSLSQYSEAFAPHDSENPFGFDLNGRSYSVHVSFVHDSGNARDNDDETRIQISRIKIDIQRTRNAIGVRTAFVGFFQDGEVFVAWDPRHVYSLGTQTVGSIYARQSMRLAVQNYLTSVHAFRSVGLGRRTLAIALPKRALGFYLENIERFHNLISEADIAALLQSAEVALDPERIETEQQFEYDSGGVREKFEVTRVAYRRNPAFRTKVLQAYDYRCCVCGIQLDLVQAAHIVPHALPESTDEVSNGLALCANHHRLYDDGLLLPSPRGVLTFNPSRARYLSACGRDAGVADIRRLDGQPFTLPKIPAFRPNDEYLLKGFRVRVG